MQLAGVPLQLAGVPVQLAAGHTTIFQCFQSANCFLGAADTSGGIVMDNTGRVNRKTQSEQRASGHLEAVLGKPVSSGNHVAAEVLVGRHTVQVLIGQGQDFVLSGDVTSQRT